MKTKQKNAEGVVLMAGASRVWKSVKSNLLRLYDVDLLGTFFYDFSQQVSSFVRSTVMCSATFRRDLLLQLLNPITQSPPSLLYKPPPSSRLRVLFLVSCVMSIYLSIDLSVHFFSPGLLAAAVSFVCYTAATLLAATS